MTDSPDLGFTREGARNIIELLRGGAANRLPYDQVRLALSVIMAASARHGVYLPYAMPAEVSLHRARQLEKKGDWFQSIRDLGPPAPDRTVAYGRCHQPGRP